VGDTAQCGRGGQAMTIAMQLTGIARPRFQRRKTRHMKQRIAAQVQI